MYKHYAVTHIVLLHYDRPTYTEAPYSHSWWIFDGKIGLLECVQSHLYKLIRTSL